ncbi:MAG: type II toxin-antitoxin system VapC family toxin [Gammaproteobacteria bacterium]|nr:type II toxin-antitoxin system VapC family toxin [Gammaproteobacteria bacterium]
MGLAYLIDTNTCIYITKKTPQSVYEKFNGLKIGELAMSMITYAELLYGVEKSQHKVKNTEILESLTHYIPVLPLSTEVASYYASIRAQLSKKGKPIGNNDLWIAAHARALDITLITNNSKEFSRVEKLDIEDWCTIE